MIYDKRECAQSVDCPGEKTAAALKTKQTVDSTRRRRRVRREILKIVKQEEWYCTN